MKKSRFVGLLSFEVLLLLLVSLLLNVVMYRKLVSREDASRVSSTAVQERSVPAGPPPVVPIPDDDDDDDLSMPSMPSMPIFHGWKLDVIEADGTNLKGTVHLNFTNLKERKRPYRVVSTEDNPATEFEPVIEPAPVEVEPMTYSAGRFSVTGRFAIGQSYTISLPSGMVLDDSRYPVVVKIPELTPGMRFTTSGTYYPVEFSQGKVSSCRLPVRLTSIQDVRVTLWGLDEKFLDLPIDKIADVFYEPESKIYDVLVRKVGESTQAVNCRVNATAETELDLTGMLDGMKPGVYIASIGNPKTGHAPSQPSNDLESTLLVLSNMGVSAVVDEQGRAASVAVRSLSGLGAVEKASVTLFSIKRQEIATGFTGADGCCLLRFREDYKAYENAPSLLLVRKGEDLTLLRLNGISHLSNAEFNNEGNAFKSGCSAFVYTERGIYRPGESVFIGVVVRQREGGAFVGESLPLEVTVLDDRQTVLEKKHLKTDENGFATFSLPLSKTALTGHYSIRCGVGEDCWGTGEFLVNLFTPNRFKVKLTAENAPPESGPGNHPYGEITDYYKGYGEFRDDKISYDVSATYYFGTPLPNGKLNFTLRGEPQMARHWTGYHVGRLKIPCKQLGSCSGNIDNGHDSVTISCPYEFLQEQNDALLAVPVKLTACCSVTEPDAATVSDTASTLYLPQEHYLGMKYVEAKGQDALFNCRLLCWEKDAQPKLEKPLELSFKLYRRDYTYAKVKKIGGMEFEWTLEETPVEDLPSLTMKEAEAAFTLPNLPDGAYRICATSEELESEFLFWHYEGCPGTVRSSNPQILAIRSDRESYAPGDKAELLVSCEQAGVCLVSAGEDSLESVQAFDVKAGENRIPVTIGKNALTRDYFVSMSYIGILGKNYLRAYGIARLRLDQERHRMNLTLALPEKAVGGNKVDLTLSCTDADGRPLASTVQVFAVDEGVLSLTKFQTPSPFNFFHGVHGCNFEAYDLYSLLYPNLALTGARKTGGDIGLGERAVVLKTKESAVVVLDTISVPENGKATASIALPKHTGALRVMAVGVSKRHLGCQDRTIVLRDKASALGSAPAALAPEDSFNTTITLFNHDCKNGAYKLSLTVPDGLSCSSPLLVEGTLAQGKSELVTFPMKAVRKGTYDISYQLSMDDVLCSGELHVTVRPLMPFTTLTDSYYLSSDETQELAPLGEWEECSSFDVQVSASPVLAVKDALEWLNAYPYGCLEQTTSTAFPMLCVDNLIKAGVVDESFRPLAKAKIEMASVALLNMRKGSRGFAGWPGSSTIWHEPGIYACHFLFKAKPSGLTTKVVKDLNSYLVDNVWDGIYREKDAILGSYAAYVLSLSPEPPQDLLHLTDRLYKERHDSSAVQFFLGAALCHQGYASRGIPLLEKGWNHGFLCGADGTWFLNTDVVCKAMGLAIAMEWIPQNTNCDFGTTANELATSLKKNGDCWGTTRENAMAVYGLAAYGAVYPAEEATLMVTRPGQAPQTLKFKDKVVLNFKEGEKATLKNLGKTALYVLQKNAGIPKCLDRTEESVIISKQYLDEKGNPVTRVKHGDLVTVRITIGPMQTLDNAVLLDLLPGGFAIEDGSLATQAVLRKDQSVNSGVVVQHQQSMDDRYLLFGKIPGGKRSVVFYRLRAISKGCYAVPPVRVEDMYETQKCGTGLHGGMIVVE